MTANTYASRQAILDSLMPLVHEKQPTSQVTHDDESPAREVTKLPEVHDHAGDSPQFHVASGKATQVMGTVAIDPSRMPDDMNPVLTDSKHRTLRVEHQVLRSERVDTGVIEIDELIQASKFAKQAKAWGARVHVTVRVSR